EGDRGEEDRELVLEEPGEVVPPRPAHARHLVLAPPVTDRFPRGATGIGMREEDRVEELRDDEEEEDRAGDGRGVLRHRLGDLLEAPPKVEAAPRLEKTEDDRRSEERHENVEVLLGGEGDRGEKGSDDEVANAPRPPPSLEKEEASGRSQETPNVLA